MQLYVKQNEEYVEQARRAQVLAYTDRLKHFWKTLGWALKKHSVKRRDDGRLNILNLACGVCEESRLLASFLSSGIPGFPTRTARFFGIDRDPRAIHDAIVGSSIDPFFNSPALHIKMEATFVCGDATQLEKHAEIPTEVDFILIRHQFIARAPVEFEKMVVKGLERLHPEGLMLFTSFFEEEHQALRAMLKRLSCQVLLAEQNPHALPMHESFPEGPVALDQFVCLIRRT